MNVRSLPLLALGLALLGSAAVLAAALVHDGAIGQPDAARLAPGDSYRASGKLSPWHLPSSDLRAWLPILGHLDNATYVLDDGSTALVLVTAPTPPSSANVLVNGQVVYAGQHPTDSARAVLVVHAQDWDHPVLR